MATWLKRVIYSKWVKGMIALGMALAACMFCYSVLGMRSLPEEAKSYVDTDSFRQAFIQKAGYLRDWIVRYDEQTIFTEITPEQIQAYIEKDGRGLSEKEARQGIVNDRNNYYNILQTELVYDNKNIDYIAIDTEKDRRITNMGSDKSTQSIINELCSRPTCLIGNGYYILQVNYGISNYNSYYNGHYFTDEDYYVGDSFEGQDNYRIYIALKEPLVEGDNFFVEYNDFTTRQLQNQNTFKNLFLSIGMAVLLMLLWISVSGHRGDEEKIHMYWFDRIPFEIQGVLFVLAFVGFVAVMDTFDYMIGINSHFYISEKIFDYHLLQTGMFCSIISIYIFIVLGIISSWIRHFKNHSMLDHIWFIRTGRSIYHHIFGERNLAVLISGVVIINLVVNVLAIKISRNYFHADYLPYYLPIFWNGLCGIILLKFALEYKALLKGAKKIADGQLDEKVDIGRTIPMLTEMADAINSMGTGLEKAVAASIKSERLKTELITNVSHDLKTPLTSIISYIDLLKYEKIDNPIASEYIEVLDERSHRLKQLVEDLVEASKVVTGNVKAQLDVLRLDELVGQAIGEYSDRIEASGLSIMTDKMEEVYIVADGRHMWRIVENLLSNVCKYAMPHTRVYVQVENKDNMGQLTIKNISKEALNINANELTERFVRGDSARTTEGSGLGLAIAQSLVDIQKGELELSIDGDLFKVEIKMPSTLPPTFLFDQEAINKEEVIEEVIEKNE